MCDVMMIGRRKIGREENLEIGENPKKCLFKRVS